MQGPLKKADEKIETESGGDSFEANDERSDEGELQAAKMNLHQESDSSGNHLSLKNSPRQVQNPPEEMKQAGNVRNSIGASELDQDRYSDSYEEDDVEEDIDEQIQEEEKEDPALASESNMFSRAEESVALTSLKYSKSPSELPQSVSPTIVGQTKNLPTAQNITKVVSEAPKQNTAQQQDLAPKQHMPVAQSQNTKNEGDEIEEDIKERTITISDYSDEEF